MVQLKGKAGSLCSAAACEEKARWVLMGGEA